jgi:hypothetical protein
MEAIAISVAMCSVLFIIGFLVLVSLCCKALRSGAEVEGGLKIYSWAFWLRIAPNRQALTKERATITSGSAKSD